MAACSGERCSRSIVCSRFRACHDRNRRDIRRLVAESDSQAQSQQQGKNEDPEDDLGLAPQLLHAHASSMRVARPASIRAMAARCLRPVRRLSRASCSMLSAHSILPQMPARELTKTSSRLAWRVVRWTSCAAASRRRPAAREWSHAARAHLEEPGRLLERTDSTPGKRSPGHANHCGRPSSDIANSTTWCPARPAINSAGVPAAMICP